jgi:dipeptidyl aminopeptidase/acylaminoacyl peptidase
VKRGPAADWTIQPPRRAELYSAALKKRGVPVRLVQFEGEYHGTGSKPSNFIRTQLYMMSWFKKFRCALC